MDRPREPLLVWILFAAVAVEIAVTYTRALRPGRLHALLAGYLALLLGYGLGNVVNDGWLEQVAKRGWTTHLFPGVTTPALNWGWAVVLAIAFAVWALWLRRATARSGASPHLPVPASDTRA